MGDQSQGGWLALWSKSGDRVQSDQRPGADLQSASAGARRAEVHVCAGETPSSPLPSAPPRPQSAKPLGTTVAQNAAQHL